MFDLFNNKTHQVAECMIQVGESAQPITEFYPFIIEVNVDVSRKQAAVASIRLESRRYENGLWLIQDAKVFKPWEPIIISVVFGDHQDIIFRGFISNVTAEYPQEADQTQVQVTCQDQSLALDREHKRIAWGADAPTTDQMILTDILAQYSLKPHLDNGVGRSNLTFHQDSTDIQLLKKRAKANAYELIFYPDSVYFGPMRLDGREPQATIRIYAGEDSHCYNFTVGSNGHQADAIAIDVTDNEGNPDPKAIKPTIKSLGLESADSSASILPPFVWRLTQNSADDINELSQQVQLQVNELAMRVRAQGELDGSLYGHALRVAETVAVDGTGDMFGGIYYVDNVKHIFNSEGYRQQFILLRNAYGDNMKTTINKLAGVI